MNINTIIKSLNNIKAEKSLLISTKFITTELASILHSISLNSNCNIKLILCGDATVFNYRYSDLEALEILLRISSDSILIKTNYEFSLQNLILIDDKFLLTDNNINTSTQDIDKFKEYFLNYFKSSEDIALSYDNILDNYIYNAMSLDNDLKDYINNLKSDNNLYKSSYLYSVLQHDTELCAATIPQYSNFNDGTYNILRLLDNNEGYTYLELGKLLQEPGKKDGAYTKYGENHAKLSVILGLAYIEKKDRSKKVFISELGKKFNLLDDYQKSILLKYQIYNIPVLKYIFNLSIKDTVDITTFLENIANLSFSTAKRRSSNIKDLFRRLREDAPEEIISVLDNAINSKSNLTNSSKIKLQCSKEDIDIISNIISNKFTSTFGCINIDLIFKSLKLRNNKFLKINNIDNTESLMHIMQEIFIDKYNFEFPFILQNYSTFEKYINQIINSQDIINRNSLVNIFISSGCNDLMASKYVNKILNSLIRIDFDNYINPKNIIFEDNLINTIEKILDSYLKEEKYISLINNTHILNMLPQIDYEWSMYLLTYVIQTFFYKKYNIISKYSSTTYKLSYIIIVKFNSNFNNINDIIFDTIKTTYGNIDCISLNELENLLWTNDIIDLRSCKSILSSEYFTIDELSRVFIKANN